MSTLVKDGFDLKADVFAPSYIGRIIEDWNRVQSDKANTHTMVSSEKGVAFAARNLLRIWPGARDLIRETSLHDYLINELGPEAGIVRGLFFDKPPGNSWALPWHKDYMIAVKTHGREGVFTQPGIAAGVPQVKAPKELLEKMLTVRVHLDDMDEENGALRVIPGSHEHYSMNQDPATAPVTISCKAGDVLFMRPLLTHSSGRGKQGSRRHRRILHLECAPSPHLPDGYHWHDFITIVEGNA